MADPSPTETFQIERRLKAPPERVFRAWTEEAELKRWFAPVGMVMTQGVMDLRPGGSFHYALRGPVGGEMWGKWTFEEIAAPERLALIQHFSDAAGGVTRHPLSATWPLRTFSTTRFEPIDGETLMTIAWTPYEAEAVEVATFESAKPLMKQAWAGTLDQLTRHLGG